MRSKMVLFFIILLLVVVALAGCIDENSSAYTAEQTIRKIKAEQETKAEIICTNTTVLKEKPYESIEYALYDITNDIEFTATASIRPGSSFIPFFYFPIHRGLIDNYFSSYIKKQTATLEPFAEEHGLLLEYNNLIIVSSQEELPYAAELLAKMIELYDLDTFKIDGKWLDIEIAYCAEEADSKTSQAISYFYMTPKTHRIYLDSQFTDSDDTDYYDLNNNQGTLAGDTIIGLDTWVLNKLEYEWRWISIEDIS